MDDLISRKAVLDMLNCAYSAWCTDDVRKAIERISVAVDDLPSAQLEIKPIEYSDCADAMLKMWMDNVVTDGEYNRIIDKLNAHWGEEGCKI